MTPKNINITPVLNGFIIQVGCQLLVTKDRSEMVAQIARYYADPAAVTKEFIDNRVNATYGNMPPQEPTPIPFGAGQITSTTFPGGLQ